ncbi:hypothetical protein GCM10009767_24880 [Kocuria aegyptia]|uniref:Uncharacterized protein n=1 Tax=Kocuria aegyptia TaxID=330943 RepID=A0ABN2KSV3_9MICC
MHETTESRHPGDDVTSSSRNCPAGCVVRHGALPGEEGRIHVGEPRTVVEEGVTARLCMSHVPDSGEQDGFYVLIGTNEYTPPRGCPGAVPDRAGGPCGFPITAGPAAAGRKRPRRSARDLPRGGAGRAAGRAAGPVLARAAPECNRKRL